MYITDDGRQVGFYKFVADRAGNLSTGTLYAAKFNQSSDANGGTFAVGHVGTAVLSALYDQHMTRKLVQGSKEARFKSLLSGSSCRKLVQPLSPIDAQPTSASLPFLLLLFHPPQISWVSLGRTDHAVLASELPKTNFSSIFDYVAPSNGTCPAGYTAVKHSYGEECLALKDGMEMHAAGFETRRWGPGHVACDTWHVLARGGVVVRLSDGRGVWALAVMGPPHCIRMNSCLARCRLGVHVGAAPAAHFLHCMPYSICVCCCPRCRYAAMLGATTEWSKWEGITFDSKRRRLYTAMSELDQVRRGAGPGDGGGGRGRGGTCVKKMWLGYKTGGQRGGQGAPGMTAECT